MYTMKTDDMRAYMRAYRQDLKKAGLCVYSKNHGPATHGVRCAACAELHRLRARARARPEQTYFRETIPTSELVAYIERRENALASGEAIGDVSETVVQLDTICVTVTQLCRAILAARRPLKSEKASQIKP
jgi:hypothetical protein